MWQYVPWQKQLHDHKSRQVFAICALAKNKDDDNLKSNVTNNDENTNLRIEIDRN